MNSPGNAAAYQAIGFPRCARDKAFSVPPFGGFVQTERLMSGVLIPAWRWQIKIAITMRMN
jgi:hypothetical protein